MILVAVRHGKIFILRNLKAVSVALTEVCDTYLFFTSNSANSLRDTYGVSTLIDHNSCQSWPSTKLKLNSASEMKDSRDPCSPIALSKVLASKILGAQNS